MSVFDDCTVQSLALLSITRSIITAESGAVLPLPGFELQGFLSAPWAELASFSGVTNIQLKAGLALAQMFPAQGVAVADAAWLENISANLSACKTPAETTLFIAKAWCASDRQVVFMSSGSTGAPKFAVHSTAMLLQELGAVLKLLPNVLRVISLSPLQHCYGFMFGLLLPLSQSLPRLSLPPLPGVARAALREGDLLAGFPDFWRNMPHEEYSPPGNVLCMSATAPWPIDEQKVLRSAGYMQSLEIFGSSENGVIGWRKSPELPFKLLSYWSKSTQDSTGLLRSLPNGSEIFCPLQDKLSWIDDRKFTPTGRSDHAVQVSGINVYPSQIAESIAALPGVAACKVRLMRPEEGWRLKAFVVPVEGWAEAELSVRLKKYFRTKLAPPERPAQLCFGSSLPKTLYGKDADW